MDIQKAIDILYDITAEGFTVGDRIFDMEQDELEAIQTAISGLQELQQYLQIGTLDDCKADREKQIAKTPDYEGDGYYDGDLVYDTWICPNCGEYYEVGHDNQDYCPKCGQHIKHEEWESE